MGRYRKIDPRVWGDEKFNDLEPMGKLLWLSLLTHPSMTPMGAGVMSPALLNEIIGNSGGYCYLCKEIQCTETPNHYAETLLETFRGTSMVFLDKGLIIVRNYLVYNRPDNPNQLYGWIESCEELPRSDCFKQLLEHLQNPDFEMPEWIIEALLKPLANQQNRTLKSNFWARIPEKYKTTPKKTGKVPRKVQGNVGGKVSGNVPAKVDGNVSANLPRNQEQEVFKGFNDEKEERKLPRKKIPKKETLRDSDENPKPDLTKSELSKWFDEVMWPSVSKKVGKDLTWIEIQKERPNAETRERIVWYFTEYPKVKAAHEAKGLFYPEMQDPVRAVKNKRYLDELVYPEEGANGDSNPNVPKDYSWTEYCDIKAYRRAKAEGKKNITLNWELRQKYPEEV